MASNQAMNEYLRLAKIKEIEEKLTQFGYDVETDAQSGEFTFDIIAEKTWRNKKKKISNEKRYIMVKTGHYSPEQIINISIMKHYVENTADGEFELIIAHPPRKKEIGFYEFEKAFEEYVIDVFNGKETSEHDDFLEYLDYLRYRSENTIIESITDIDIDLLDVRDDEIFVRGSAAINIVLQFNDMDTDELKIIDSCYCSFDANVYDVFGYSGPTIEIDEFQLDIPEDTDEEID